MSKYKEIQTEIDDPTILAQTLQEVGERLEFQFEDHRHAPAQVKGYMGDLRQQTAHFIVRKRFVTASSNDLGWQQQPDGKFTLLISDYDAHTQRALEIAEEVAYHYTVVKAERAARLEGYTIKRQCATNGQVVHLYLST